MKLYQFTTIFLLFVVFTLISRNEAEVVTSYDDNNNALDQPEENNNPNYPQIDQPRGTAVTVINTPPPTSSSSTAKPPPIQNPSKKETLKAPSSSSTKAQVHNATNANANSTKLLFPTNLTTVDEKLSYNYSSSSNSSNAEVVSLSKSTSTSIPSIKCPGVVCDESSIEGATCEVSDVDDNFQAMNPVLRTLAKCCPVWTCRRSDGSFFTHFEVSSTNNANAYSSSSSSNSYYNAQGPKTNYWNSWSSFNQPPPVTTSYSSSSSYSSNYGNNPNLNHNYNNNRHSSTYGQPQPVVRPPIPYPSWGTNYGYNNNNNVGYPGQIHQNNQFQQHQSPPPLAGPQQQLKFPPQNHNLASVPSEPNFASNGQNQNNDNWNPRERRGANFGSGPFLPLPQYMAPFPQVVPFSGNPRGSSSSSSSGSELMFPRSY